MKKRILFTAAALVCAANLTAQCLGVGSSTSSMSPEEMAAAAKAGVEYVEIGISGRGTVAEIREKALHAKRMADEAGLKVWSCHLPFSRKLDISVLNDSARMANLEFLTEMIAICGEVGPEKLVLHPSSEPIAGSASCVSGTASLRSAYCAGRRRGSARSCASRTCPARASGGTRPSCCASSPLIPR